MAGNSEPAGGAAPLVLLIDDAPDAREAYAFLLARSGWRVVEADSGEAGLRLAMQHVPQAVVVDVHLPDLDGYTLTRRLRSEPATRGVCVIVMTGRSREDSLAREAGADGYLVKPVEPAALLAELQQCTSRPRT